MGGTGKEGKGLAFRWARAGFEILIGSRQIEKAQLAAEEVNNLLGGSATKVIGLDNLKAAKNGDIVVLTVPFSAHQSMVVDIASAIKNKILIDVTVPLVPPKVTKVQMPIAGSAAQEAKLLVDETTEVVAAFQNISYERLMHDIDIDCDVLVTGSSKAARIEVLTLVEMAGMTGWDAGPIENSVVVEGLTSILIGLNKEFGSTSAGIKITGISRDHAGQ
ncbi:MAG: NADPH-dependent F420 reductase [Anaerolineaceae bacterium]|nr:NADPH-dependent F420 reductase [Anaerolineaceae bacterium]